MKGQRFGALASLLLLWPTVAAAQSSRTAAQNAPMLPPIGLPLPQMGLPLPPIGLPLSNIGLAPNGERPHHPWLPPDTHPRPPAHDGKGRSRPVTVVYFGSPYPWYDPSPQSPGATASEPPSPQPPSPRQPPSPAPALTGRLELEIQPHTDLQLFVDGEYVGTGDDVGGALELEAGTRRIEIRARNYEPILFNARIAALRTMTYRATLTPSQVSGDPQAPPAKPVERKRQTFYLIPGCYLGNIPPQEVRLPAGCDLSRLITHTP
jgi:hypothetical protein